MKKLTLIVLFGLAPWCIQAQTQKGSQSVGLMFNLQDNKLIDLSDESTNRRLRIYPNYEYFIMENFALVGGVSFDRTRGLEVREEGIDVKRIGTTWNTYLGFRKYWEVNPGLFLSLTNGIGFNWEDQKTEFQPFQNPSGSIRANQWSLFSQLGLVYFPMEKFAFELILLRGTLEYRNSYSYPKSDDSFTISWLSMRKDLILNQPTVSIRYYF